jgi:hypothetical protein
MSAQFARFFSVFLAAGAFAGAARRHSCAKNRRTKNNREASKGALKAN